MAGCKGTSDVHYADGEGDDELSARPKREVEFVKVVCWPDIDYYIETAVQRQDGEVLVTWATAVIAIDGFIPVTVDGSIYVISIHVLSLLSPHYLRALCQCQQPRTYRVDDLSTAKTPAQPAVRLRREQFEVGKKN